jgi:hypothetical protein
LKSSVLAFFLSLKMVFAGAVLKMAKKKKTAFCDF